MDWVKKSAEWLFSYFEDPYWPLQVITDSTAQKMYFTQYGPFNGIFSDKS